MLVEFKNDVIYKKLHMDAWKKEKQKCSHMHHILAHPEYTSGLLCHSCSPISAVFFYEIWRGRSLYSNFIKEVKNRIYTREVSRAGRAELEKRLGKKTKKQVMRFRTRKIKKQGFQPKELADHQS